MNKFPFEFKGKSGKTYTITKMGFKQLWSNFIETSPKNLESIKDKENYIYFDTPNMFSENEDIIYCAFFEDLVVSHVQYDPSMNMLLTASTHKLFRNDSLATNLLEIAIKDIPQNTIYLTEYSKEGETYLHPTLKLLSLKTSKTLLQYDKELGYPVDIMNNK
ncbi:MAG: hypothetical protein E6R13_03805 [Spirochaetes bacterium]|nr:MAG: hypothetical protein E6R13_03805 [Spirochaetota bacterium]